MDDRELLTVPIVYLVPDTGSDYIPRTATLLMDDRESLTVPIIYHVLDTGSDYIPRMATLLMDDQPRACTTNAGPQQGRMMKSLYSCCTN